MPKAGRKSALLLALAASAAPLAAQTPTPAPAAASGRSYTQADFVRFAPRNAFDMLSNVPGFAIASSDTDRRGLGQASGNVLINGARFSGKSTDILSELRRISASNVARIDSSTGRRSTFRASAGRWRTSSPCRAAFPAISSTGPRSGRTAPRPG